MSIKPFFYSNASGIHYPDICVNSTELHGVDFREFLSERFAVANSVVWNLEEGLVEESSYEDGVNDNVYFINIQCDKLGVFEIKCELDYTESSKPQKKVIKLLLKVV